MERSSHVTKGSPLYSTNTMMDTTVTAVSAAEISVAALVRTMYMRRESGSFSVSIYFFLLKKWLRTALMSMMNTYSTSAIEKSA